MNDSGKDPTFASGDPVRLKADKNARPWIVLRTYPSGTIQICRAGRPPSMYTTMNVLPTHLKREGDTP